jgi:hypothetical protein
MAIRNIKEIINNKGYIINSNDRKIFEEGDLQSFFGFSDNDAIEFIIYDINDNQLPQLDGSLVRYVTLSTENINDYFLIPDGTLFQKYQLPKEYFIDAERLLKEAGYTNGIFKTQTTLINKRAGSEKVNDKLWIQEISPSRTEVRVFPLKEGVLLYPELLERYNIFVNGGDFREDTIAIAINFLEKIQPNEVYSFLLQKYTKEWLDRLVSEFKLNSIDELINKIHATFIKSAIYEFTNRISDIKDINYGSLKSTKPPIALSKTDILSISKSILVSIIDYYLPQRDETTVTTTIDSFNESINNSTTILESYSSDTNIPPKTLDNKPISVGVIENINKIPVKETDVDLEQKIKEEVNYGVIPKIITPETEPEYIPIQKESTESVSVISTGGYSYDSNSDSLISSQEASTLGISQNSPLVIGSRPKRAAIQ